MLKKLLCSSLLALGLMSGAAVHAQATDSFDPYMVRVRGVYVGFQNGQSGGLPLAGNTKVEAVSTWIPEFDLTYFFTKNIAAELVLTWPQNIDINVGGAKAGTIQALPPSLLLQYHFTDLGAFKPYVGLGVNYTFFYQTNNILGGAASINNSSFGVAGQVGFDYALTKNWQLNVDLKWIQMATDVSVLGNKVGTVNLNPLTVGVGIGYRF